MKFSWAATDGTNARSEKPSLKDLCYFIMTIKELHARKHQENQLEKQDNTSLKDLDRLP